MRRLRLALLLFLTCIAGTHCEDDGDDGSLVEDATVWRLDVNRSAETDKEHYFWNTTLREAWVNYRVHDYVEGTFRLRIYDDDDLKIFDKEYHHGDDRTTPTFLGRPGVWHIQADYSGFTGDLSLTIDAAPPSFLNGGVPLSSEDPGSSPQGE